MTIVTLFQAENACIVDVFGYPQPISLQAGDAVLWDNADGSLYSFKKQRLETPIGATFASEADVEAGLAREGFKADAQGNFVLAQPVVRQR